jgi:hypothetical protein
MSDYRTALDVVREAVRDQCRSDIGEVTFAAQIVEALVAAGVIAHPLDNDETREGPIRCIGIEVTPLGGGIRQVSGCWRRVTETVDGQPHCRQHADEARWRAKEFQRMMDTATRHSPGIRWHGKGTECLCGEFVPEGTEHPWGVPEKLERQQEGTNG